MASAAVANSSANIMKSPKTSNSTTVKDSDASQSDTNPQAANKPAKVEGGEENRTTNAPFAPPPKPSQNQSNQQSGNDYYSGPQSGAHFSLEPNPFEQSFGQPSGPQETSGKFGGLPSVQSLTSPAPLQGEGTPGWQNSLRSGPLSPAMLTGPANSNGDYFDSSFRQSFPTPNESSLRSTGLTPGSSMFPAPSPNSQAIFNSLQSAGATPGTLDFQRTAMNAAARNNKSESGTGQQQSNQQGQSMQGINKQDYQPAQQNQNMSQNFNNNSEHDAVNSLYMLANNGQRNPNQFSMSNQQPGGINTNVAQMQNRSGGNQDTSPSYARGGANQGSLGGMSASTGGGMSENGDYGSDASMDAKPNNRGRNRKQGNKGNTTSNGGRRKADDAPAKGGSGGQGGSNKKQKGNSGHGMPPGMNIDDMSDDEDQADIKDEPETGRDGKKLTDEEKRKNFLERNRVAALKCRQRKKQWLANLQAKVEIFTTENDALTTQCAQLREENQNLKALLYQHKDCPVSHQQGLGGSRMAQVLGAEFESGPQSGQQGPPGGYGGMGMPPMGQGMQGQGMHG